MISSGGGCIFHFELELPCCCCGYRDLREHTKVSGKTFHNDPHTNEDVFALLNTLS